MLRADWDIFWKGGIRCKKAQEEKETWNFNEIRRPTSVESETMLGAHRSKYEHNLNMKDKSANVVFSFASSEAGKTPFVFWFVLALGSLCICTFVNLPHLNLFILQYFDKIRNLFHYTHFFQFTF